jgi:hypothetical protein
MVRKQRRGAAGLGPGAAGPDRGAALGLAVLVPAVLALASLAGCAGSTSSAPHPVTTATATVADTAESQPTGTAKSQPASPGPAGPGPFAADATDRKLAASLAAAAQRVFPAPPGSRKLAGPPAGTWRDQGGAGSVVGAGGQVSDTSWWQVPGPPQAVLKWLFAHTPRGWYGGGQGSYGPPSGAKPGARPPAGTYWSWNDSFENDHGPAVIGAQLLVVTEIENSAGQVYTRVDSLVAWIPPRSATERVPASAKVVTITAEPMAGTAMPPGSPVTVTDPATVARIAALVNGLYRSTSLCAPPVPSDNIRLDFRAVAGGPSLATADVDFRGCGQVRFSVPGAAPLPLLAEVNGELVPTILSTAGLHWFA